MSITVSPALADVYTALRALIVAVVPAGVPVVQGIQNRAAMPLPAKGFVVMQAIGRSALRTPIDTWDNVAAPTTQSIEQGVDLHMQLDFYGPSSPEWATMVSTLFRDEAGCTLLAPNCAPLHADEARMVPLIDEEAQYEQRWMLEAHLQYNPVTVIGQQFAEALKVELINIDEAFPP